MRVTIFNISVEFFQKIVHNDCVKKLIIISLLFLSSSLVYSEPYYDPNIKPIVYDVSYNIELYHYLDSEYDKKCHRQISATEGEDICGTDSHYQMVMKPYARLMKTMEESPFPGDSKKSKAELLKEIKEDIAYYKELENNYNKICGPKEELYYKKVEEAKQKGYFYLKNKIYDDMVKDGSLCSPTAHLDMIFTPFHERRMSKFKK